MTSLQELQRNWESLAQEDPLWSICTDPEKRHHRWEIDEFFATGKREIEIVMEHLRGLEIPIDRSAPALDFGCGVGRLTRALAEYFPDCFGVDISPTMIRLAEDFNLSYPRCHFRLNQSPDLQIFEDRCFGFIYTSIVFQHIERSYVEKYLAELVRTLKPGGILVFQIVDRFHAGAVARLRHRLKIRRRISRWFKAGQDTFQMEMHCLPESQVRELLKGLKVRISDVRRTNSAEPDFNGRLQFLDHDPEHGFISKQYCVIKNPLHDCSDQCKSALISG